MSNRSIELLLIAISFLLLSSLGKAKSNSQLTSETIILSVNESRRVPVNPFQKIEVTGSEFLKIKDLKNQLEIKGLKKGSSSINSGSKSYQIHIVSASQAQDYKKLIQLARQLNFNSKVENGQLLLSGELQLQSKGGESSLTDWLESIWSLDIREGFGWRLQLTSDQQIKMRSAVFQRAKQLNLPQFELTLSPALTARTAQLTDSQKKSMLQFCKRLGLDLEEQSELLPQQSSLVVTLYFIEAKKQWLSQIGVSWPPSQAFKVIPQFSGDQLQAILNFSESQGQTRNLAAPKLIVKSHEKGEFLSGGEFPIRVSGFQNQSLFWKKYGLMFEIKPKIDRSRRVDLDLKFELSMIDPSRSVDGLPGLVTHSMQTQLQIMAGQTLLVSSLLKKEWGRSKTGIPGLKDIPLLSSLFSSEDFLNNETELILFIQTQLVEN